MKQSIQGTTKICAVIGDPVEHSLSPCMHNAAFQALQLDYAYVAFHVKDVGKAMEGVLGLGIRGLSVTIPHKVETMKYLDEITPLARRIGAINTVTNENGRLLGTNTDGFGALKAIEDCEKVDGKNVVFLGVGGAARGVAFTIACERSPKSITFAYRGDDEAMAESLIGDLCPHASAQIFTASLEPSDLSGVIRSADIIIHTTPIGMYPHVDGCLVDEAMLSERHLVFDVVYNPAKTLLLQRAERKGGRIVNGVPMFVNQGAEQFRLWTGQEPPVDVMREAVENALVKK